MKMSMVCMIILCLAMRGLSSTPITPLSLLLGAPEQEVAHLKEELKDATKLRTCVKEKVLGSGTGGVRMPREFMRRFDVSDEAMETALLDIIREAAAKTKWKKRQGPDDKTVDKLADWFLYEGILVLGLCASEDGKKLLMDIATDNAKDSEFRSRAIMVYMSRADAKETMDAIARFLADDMRTSVNPYDSGIYRAAIWSYDKAEDDPQKREAIIAMVSAALAKEEDKKAFDQADKLLAERSKEYAESPQRKAAQERFRKPPKEEVK